MAAPASQPSGERTSRQQALQRALVALGAVAVGSVAGRAVTSEAATGPSRAQDTRILDFMLLLERLQEGLYEAAAARSGIRGELAHLASVAGAHERAHVQLLERLLGSAAAPKPTLRFDHAVRTPRVFAQAALKLEETATAAMIGESANLTAGRVLDVAQIVSVDARHAAWLRDLAGVLPAPRAADPSQSAAAADRFIRGSGYVVRR